MINTIAPITIEAAEKYIKDAEIFNYSSSIISVTDEKGVLLYVNDLFCDITEYSSEELIGKFHNILAHPDM